MISVRNIRKTKIEVKWEDEQYVFEPNQILKMPDSAKTKLPKGVLEIIEVIEEYSVGYTPNLIPLIKTPLKDSMSDPNDIPREETEFINKEELISETKVLSEPKLDKEINVLHQEITNQIEKIRTEGKTVEGKKENLNARLEKRKAERIEIKRKQDEKKKNAKLSNKIKVKDEKKKKKHILKTKKK